MEELEEQTWLAKCRTDVIAYLQAQGISNGHIDDYPAWCCSPHVSVWAIETVESSGSLGWWVVCGDHPTDHIAAKEIKDAQTVLGIIGERWKEWSSQMLQGKPHPRISIASPEHGLKLGEALQQRADFFVKCATDDETWDNLKWTRHISSWRPIYPIKSEETPREIIEKDFDLALPIRGGWGYSKQDACVIDKNDPIVNPALPFNGVGLEKVFVEKRIYEELIVFRRIGEKFAGIRWEMLQQNLIPDNNRYFDKLIFEITAFRDKDWDQLKAEWEGPDGHESPDFDLAGHEKKRQDRMIRLTREFWFDITSFFGQNAPLANRNTTE